MGTIALHKNLVGKLDLWLYIAGPIFMLLGVVLSFVVIPFGPQLIISNLGIGIFYFIFVMDLVALGIAVSGWGANTKDSIESCYRSIAQLTAYLVPIGLMAVGVIMMAHSLSTVSIVEAQSHVWFIVLQPIGFLLFLVAALMQTYRPPFNGPFSAEINYGIFGAYKGMNSGLLSFIYSSLLFVVSAMGATLFLGGWLGPILPGFIWLLLKTFSIMALLLWIGKKIKPLSPTKMLALSWKILIPVGLLNVLIVGALILLGVGPK
jgi:NADH-quinone oxidoreductase subunit H